VRGGWASFFFVNAAHGTDEQSAVGDAVVVERKNFRFLTRVDDQLKPSESGRWLSRG
jgi:hypothetical protein